MATQKDNLLVSLLKRSVGMSSGGCCGAPAACGCGSSADAEAAQAPTQAPDLAKTTPPAEPKPDGGRSGCC